MKTLIIVLQIFFTVYCYSQNLSGVAVYRQSISFGDSTKINPKTLALYFNQGQSLFFDDKSNILGMDTVKVIASNDYKSLPEIYKNFGTQKIISREIAFTEKVIVQDTMPLMVWEILKDTKEIATYKCQRAKTFFRGREYIAWFTSQIPVSDGPWKFHGLPGLILEAGSIDNKIRFNLVSINESKSNRIATFTPPKVFKKSKVLTWNEYVQTSIQNKSNFTKQVQSDPRTGDATLQIDVKRIEIFPDK